MDARHRRLRLTAAFGDEAQPAVLLAKAAAPGADAARRRIERLEAGAVTGLDAVVALALLEDEVGVTVWYTSRPACAVVPGTSVWRR